MRFIPFTSNKALIKSTFGFDTGSNFDGIEAFGIMSLLAITRYFFGYDPYLDNITIISGRCVRNRLFQHLLKMGPQFYQNTRWVNSLSHHQ